MDFAWSAPERELYDAMRALGAEAAKAPDDTRLEVLAKGGALGLSLPKEHGGGGHTHVATARAYEGLGHTLADGGVLLAAAGAHLFGVASMIAKVGSPEQQRALLPSLASGTRVATVAATELGSGSDIASVASVAERRGEGFRVTGEKRFVTYADRADLFFTVARDGQGRGLTALLLPRSAATRSGALLATAGLRGARLAPLTIDGAEVGPEMLLGRAGAGLAVFQIAMTFERALVLAFRLGAMARALDDAIAFAKKREIAGAPIARHQAVAHRIARMRLRLETSRLLTYRAAWELDQNARGQLEAALAKWHVAESAVESALDAMRVRGGSGYMEDTGLPGELDDALGGAIHSGTEDVLATIVARWVGL